MFLIAGCVKTADVSDGTEVEDNGALAGQAVSTTCTDSDGGENLLLKGTVTGYNYINNKLETKSDFCYISGTAAGKLGEYKCIWNATSRRNEFNVYTKPCPTGTTCPNYATGACVTPCTPIAATSCTAGVSCPGNIAVPATGCPSGQSCDATGNCVAPPAVCGNNIIEGTEQCDGTMMPVEGSFCPAGTTGSVACFDSSSPTPCMLNTTRCVATPTCTGTELKGACEGNTAINYTCSSGAWTEIKRTECPMSIGLSGLTQCTEFTTPSTPNTNAQCAACGSILCVSSTNSYFTTGSCYTGYVQQGSPVSGPNCAASCSDSDGDSLTTFGTVSYAYSDGRTGSISDSCSAMNSVNEAKCSGSNPVLLGGICAFGDSCREGQCVLLTCNDPDGENVTTKETVTVTYPDGTVYATGTDECYSSKVREKICGTSGVDTNNVFYKLITCPSGKSCKTSDPGRCS
ncbi:hypothetical protein HYU21_01460 [Candidatus Woesearchaeota archaeon]|nr:hypothetical protein [Candidatus Woesearchaeota archaeon]